MDPGEFNKLIDLVRPTGTGRDAAGAPVQTSQLVARVWAKVAFPGGKEFLANSGTDTSRRGVFRIYPRPVDLSMKIMFDGSDWDIQDVRPFDDVVELHAVTQQVPGPQ
ncbi:head-tail adaptor protein [Brevundimonas sp. S30B]|uniref:phage head closure protein n=1 Tax=unclassified Brevundimonas TaxID=2622653 RepID=UPI00107215A5|nr:MULTISPECIES: phage head closure protein [unclassified Brevundimonas]QBX37224.1 head-tail adaptor protein [Brevundimonas sp. MF30-B]TFW03982.1 head-tail adaptor protein [Brevundimonas sp. S30B]